MKLRFASVLAAAVVVVVAGMAQPASAHAVLLRSDPSPQTTVSRPPSAIRLEFSEPVEVAFGAIRVFDVDGRRLDAGRIQLADGDRDVILPVSGLKDGTYTVTWRVASADGHRVSGGFDFYVGSPSTISAVAVERDQGPGRVVGWGFGVVRVFWFASLAAVIGLVVTRRWVWTPALRAAALAESPAATTYRRWFRRALPAAWVVLAVSGALMIVFQASTLSGLSLVKAAEPDVVREVLRTTFGRVWVAQMALTLLTLVPVLALARGSQVLGLSLRAWIAALGVLTFALGVGAGLAGHARTYGASALAVTSIAVHLMAVGVWVGGLGALVVVGGAAGRKLRRDQRAALLRQVVPRFSRLAIGGVAAIVVSGTVNSVANLASVSDLWRLEYGRVLLAKIGVLVVALALAARHFWIVPRRLARAETEGRAAGSFQRTAAVELGLLGLAIVLGATLVALVPGRSVALAARGPVNQEQTIGPYTAQLFIDPTAVGENEIHVTFVNAQGLGAGEVTNAAAELTPPNAAPQAVSMRLISPGHFVGDATLAVPGEYKLSVSTGGNSTNFEFRLRSNSSGDP